MFKTFFDFFRVFCVLFFCFSEFPEGAGNSMETADKIQKNSNALDKCVYNGFLDFFLMFFVFL